MKVNARDYPDMYSRLGIDTSRMGCIMVDTEPIPEDVIPPESWGAVDEASRFVRRFETARHPHATLMYGLLQPGPEIRHAVDEVLADWRMPDRMEIVSAVAFDTPEHYGYNPIVLKPDGATTEALREANSQLQLLPHIRMFKEFRAHITLGYAKKERARDALDYFYDRAGSLTLKVTGLNYGK